MPDEDGHLVLLDAQGQVLDELAYKDDWHFKLISDDEGVSLERMDPSAPTQNKNNWHSAASSAGYGTPGYVNSQYRQSNNLAAMISVEPPIISPDNDGRDDRAVIRYQLTEPGFVANILLYDVEGRLLRRLVSNSILGSSGYWTWDGLDENGNRLPFGIYILFTEIYNLQGKKARFKNSIVVGKK